MILFFIPFLVDKACQNGSSQRHNPEADKDDIERAGEIGEFAGYGRGNNTCCAGKCCQKTHAGGGQFS